MHRLSRSGFALLLLVACGDDGGVTSGASATGSTTMGTTGATATTPGTSSTSEQPTTGTTQGSGSDSETASSSGPTTGGTTTTTGVTASTGTTGSTTSTTEPDTTTTGTTTGSTTEPDTTDTSSSSTTGQVEQCACPDIEVPLDDGIFVLSDTAELWKYFPAGNNFEMLGQISCPGLFSTFSMAVDRLGFAWVQFNGSGELRKVDVTNVANCSDPGYNMGQVGVTNFGMAFVSNSQSDTCDRIYGNTYSGFGGYTEGPNVGDFITIDPDSLILSKLGKTNFDGAELTGTGDGRAFIFGGANPSKLVEADKATGAPISVLPLNGLEINNGAFAFAFFAGDFYFFTDSDNDLNNSEVTHIDFDDSDNDGKQQLTQLTDNAPLLIVGAGVSTCAPVAPQ